MVRKNDYLWGHQKELSFFKQAIARKKLHHAWLITGQEGIGKTTFAYHLARLLLGTDSAAIQRIKAGSHADLLTIARSEDKKKQRLRSEILLEDIKAVGEFLKLTPAEGGWRVVIIEEADLMNRNAANSLLKLLEEPPKGSILLLVTAHPGRLLPTIRSRCRNLQLTELNNEEMREGLAHLAPNIPQEKQETAIKLSEGALGKALLLLEKDSLTINEVVEKLLDNGFYGQDVYQQVDIILQQNDGFSLFINLLGDAIAHRIRQAVQSNKESFGQPLRAIPHWIDIWQKILDWHNKTERFNLDKRQTLISEFNLVSAQ